MIATGHRPLHPPAFPLIKVSGSDLLVPSVSGVNGLSFGMRTGDNEQRYSARQ